MDTEVLKDAEYVKRPSFLLASLTSTTFKMLSLSNVFVATVTLLHFTNAAVVPRAAHPELNGMTVFGYQGWYPILYPNGTGTNFKWFDPQNVTPGPPTAGQRGKFSSHNLRVSQLII